jgi:hypothetical protein
MYAFVLWGLGALFIPREKSFYRYFYLHFLSGIFTVRALRGYALRVYTNGHECIIVSIKCGESALLKKVGN